jgi:poly(3-hydroxybutyrate) depolymerase
MGKEGQQIMKRIVSVLSVVAALCAVPASAQQLLEHAIPSGANYDKAEFRMWLPPNTPKVRAVLVLVPGSNGDGRPQAEDAFWQAFASKHRLAIVACRFTDKPHEQSFLEDYVKVSDGSGQALIDAVSALAKAANHPEIATAPFLMWGMSAGGQVDYEFAAWKPERVIAFVVNKGGVYYSALVPRAARSVPALLFVGDKDLAFRINTIQGLFAVNRRAGALWAYVVEPDTAHAVGRSKDLGAMFFEDVLAMRLSGDTLVAVPEKSGFIGDLTAVTFQPVATAAAPTVPTSWLPTERIARGWQAVVSRKPFEP